MDKAITMPKSRGRAMARKYRPAIYQEYKSVYDLLLPIHSGSFNPDQKPTVYYSAKEDRKFIYLLYCFFHRKDYSRLPWPLKTLDEHEYDFEGALFALKREQTDYRLASNGWMASVSHHSLKFRSGIRYLLTLDSGGHAVGTIPPGYTGCRCASGNEIFYIDYRLVDINTRAWQRYLFGELEPLWNKHGVHTPRQWNDRRIKRRYGKETDGLIYSDPASLERIADKLGLWKCDLTKQSPF